MTDIYVYNELTKDNNGNIKVDAQFTAMECEPLRASGKVLLADKVLLVAQAAGPRRLDDADWRTAYARATHAILVKPMITIDVAAMAVTY
jgi:hypothetical protein